MFVFNQVADEMNEFGNALLLLKQVARIKLLINVV